MSKQKLPVGWEEVELKNLIENMHQGINTVTEKVEYLDNGCCIIQSKHITGGKLDLSDARFVSKEDYEKYKEKYNPKKGDLLICNIGTIGKNIIIKENQDFLIAWNLFLLKLKKDIVSPEFLKLYLDKLNAENYFDRFLTGGTVKFINKAKMGSILIPLPTLATQKKIVSILEKAEAAKELRKEADELTNDFLKSVFLEIFGDPMKNPKGWESKKLASEVDDIRYGTGSPPEYQENGIPFIRATNIKKGTVQKEGLVFISQQEARKIQKCKVKTGDLLLVRSGVNTGDCALIPNEYDGAYAAYDLILQIPYPKNYYYNFLINSNYGKSIIASLSRRAGQPHINAEQVKSMKLPIPPIQLLKKFAQIIEGVEAIKQSQKFSQQETNNLFNVLMQKAFRGELTC
jgi:type I restriction enzyme, S subunit